MESRWLSQFFTVSANYLGSLSEKQDAIGRGHVELEPLRPVLDELGEQFQHRRCNLGILVPYLNGALEDRSVGWINPVEKHHVGDLGVEGKGDS